MRLSPTKKLLGSALSRLFPCPIADFYLVAVDVLSIALLLLLVQTKRIHRLRESAVTSFNNKPSRRFLTNFSVATMGRDSTNHHQTFTESLPGWHSLHQIQIPNSYRSVGD